MRFGREVVCFVVDGYIVDLYCLKFGREVACIVVAGYLVDHHCFRAVIVVQ